MATGTIQRSASELLNKRFGTVIYAGGLGHSGNTTTIDVPSGRYAIEVYCINSEDKTNYYKATHNNKASTVHVIDSVTEISGVNLSFSQSGTTLSITNNGASGSNAIIILW